MGYKGFQWVTRRYKGFPRGRRGRDYKRFKGLLGITGDYKELQGVTGGYKGLQGVRTGYKELQGVTRGYKGDRGLQEVTGNTGGLKG